MLVVVGRIGRAHGIRGDVSIEVRTDEPENRFIVGGELITDSGRRLRIRDVKWHSGRLLLAFDGVQDRTEVEQLRGMLLQVERDEAETPEDPEEFYDSALIGCRVVGEDGVDLGTVREVAHLPAHDLLVIDREGSEVLIPFVRDFVPEVDIAARRIVVTPPEGLLDAEAP